MILPTIKELTAQDGTGMLLTSKVELFNNILTSTRREGVDKVLEFLKGTDFYTAPASSQYHSNYNGGLLDHSLAVCTVASKLKETYVGLNPALAEKLTDESVIISSLLHDVCKVCLYVPTEKYKKDEQGRWQTYMGYSINDTFPIGHGEKSVIMLQNFGLKMTVDEMLAIRYHMGLWGEFFDGDVKAAYYKAIEKCPLVSLLQVADYTSSQMMETRTKVN